VFVDLSVVIQLDIGKDNTALGYSHTFSLQSTPFAAPLSDMCLTVEYTAQAKFAVKLACLREKGVEMEVLRWSKMALGLVMNRMNLVVSGKGAEYQKCILIFDISAPKSGVAGAMSSVTLTNGTCTHPGVFCFAF